MPQPVSKHVKHVPKHRGAPPRHALVQAPRKALRTTVILSSVAVAATGATIAGGLLTNPTTTSGAASDLSGSLLSGRGTSAASLADTSDTDASVDTSDTEAAATDPATTATTPAAEPAERTPVVSRSSDRREAADPVKEAALSVDGVRRRDRQAGPLRRRPARDRPGAAGGVRLRSPTSSAASTRSTPASPTGTSTPTTPTRLPTASRRRSPARRWPPPAPTGPPTRSPRSAGASATSRTATAARAAPGATASPRLVLSLSRVRSVLDEQVALVVDRPAPVDLFGTRGRTST